jgi:hypothetical protein
VAKGEANIAIHQEELAARTWRLQEQEASLQTREAKVEEYLAEPSTSIDRIVRWAGEVNPSLDALGLSPIRVAEAPPSLGAVFPVLDSATECLQHLESAIFDLLETEGRAVARGMAEYILTCFRSHDPAFQLTPVWLAPSGRRRPQRRKECRKRRTWWRPAFGAVPDLQGGETPPDHQNNRNSIFFVAFAM